jgi:hypothetical protein
MARSNRVLEGGVEAVEVVMQPGRLGCNPPGEICAAHPQMGNESKPEDEDEARTILALNLPAPPQLRVEAPMATVKPRRASRIGPQRPHGEEEKMRRGSERR